MFYASLAPVKEGLVTEKNTYGLADTIHRRTAHFASPPKFRDPRTKERSVQYLDWWYYHKAK